jgi:hypothetical protein
MRIPLKIDPIQQMNLIWLQLSTTLKLPLTTGPPRESPELLLGFVRKACNVRVRDGPLEVTMALAVVEGLKVAIICVPGGGFEE